MQSKPSMQWLSLLVTFTVTISFVAIGLAQVADDEAEGTITTETGNQAVEPVTPPDTTTDNSSSRVVDYEPSESISEDLSVSFPVDI